jgi:N-acetylglucosamine malate deacetylase 1
VFDISASLDQKIESVRAYKTQFYNPQSDDTNQTYISTPEFLDGVIARAAMFGKMIGVKYGEGFITKKMIGIKSFDALIKENT